uniref:SdrD B-like domain-containing protein n=1 Tax=Candidatus Albibeggiatoa sp. nov. BB20 TaxID=3162723 RepID=UPI0033657A0F
MGEAMPYYNYTHSLRSLRVPILMLVMLTLSSFAASVQAKPELALQQIVSKDTVLAGEQFSYILRYRCASTTEHCENVKINMTLPAELQNKISQGITPHIESYSYRSWKREAEWIFKHPLPAGSTGELSVLVNFPNGSTADGTTINTEATMNADNADSVISNQVSVTAQAQPEVTFIKQKTGGSYLNSDVTYRLKVCNKNTQGRLNYNNLTLVDTLFEGAQFVSATNDGSYNADTHTVSWAYNNLAIGKCFQPYVKVVYPTEIFSVETEVTNIAEVTGTFVGGLEIVYQDSISHILKVPTGVGSGRLDAWKQGYSKALIGQTIYYGFYLKNAGSFGIQDLSVVDPIPAQIEVTRIHVGKGNKADIPVNVAYQTNVQTEWVDLSGNPYVTPPRHYITVDSLGLADGEYITYLRWSMDTIPIGYKAIGNYKSDWSGFQAKVLPTARNGQEITVGNQFWNRAQLSYHYEGQENIVNRSLNRKTTIIAAQAKPYLYKSLKTNSMINQGENAKFELRLKNNGNTGLINPVITDLLVSDLSYVGWTVTSKPSDAPLPQFGIEDNRLVWSWDGDSAYSLQPGKQIKVLLTVNVSDKVSGVVENRAYTHSADPDSNLLLSSCNARLVDVNDIDTDGNIEEQVCASNKANFSVSSVAAMDAVKWVKGQLDNEWHRYPNSGRTVLAGGLDYRLIMTNIGNVPMSDVVVIDILPFVGDTGVIDLQGRDSQWTPQLIGAVQAANDVVVYYSPAQNPCRDEVLNPSPADCEDPQWSTILPADITSVRSLKFDFGDVIIEPGDELKLTWPMTAPITSPIGTITWNSFGYAAKRADLGTYLLPSEPIKVGIEVEDFQPAIYGDYVWNDENGDGIQDESETGVNNVRVELYKPGTDGIVATNDDELIGFTLTSNSAEGTPGFYIFSNLKPGAYFAKFYPPVGYGISPKDRGDDDLVDSDVNPDTNLVRVTVLDAEERDLSWDMGIFESGSAALGNYVWFDKNKDGQQNESSDKGINDITVTLYQDNGDDVANVETDTLLAITQTTNDVNGLPGFYLFDELDPGQYFVQFSLPEDAYFTTQGATGSSDATDSDPDSNGVTEIVSLTNGDYDPTWDAGIVLPIGELNLGNRVWFDDDKDGIYTAANEEGINDVKLNLYRDTDGNGEYTVDVDKYLTSTTTFTKDSVEGYYIFKQLIAGDYIVQIDHSNFRKDAALEGLISSSGAADTNAHIDHDDNGAEVSGLGIISNAIHLDEPPEGGEYSDLTVDFGFHTEEDDGQLPVSCDNPQVYALQDHRLNDSQFFTIDPTTLAVAPLGNVYAGYDIETLDIHPHSNKLYAASGDDPAEGYPNGFLYNVNPETGEVLPLGSTGLGEVSAISFNPDDGTLWAWADGEGLFQITFDAGVIVVTPVLTSTLKIEGLTWDSKGKALYAAVDQQLWVWSPETSQATLACDLLPGQTEALEMIDGEILVFGIHTGSDLNIYAWNVNDLQNCQTEFEVHVQTDYNDIEGIT